MNLLLDQNVPIVIVPWLLERRVIATHLTHTSLPRASDRDIANWARGRFDAVVTKDKDFQTHIPLSAQDPLQLVHLRIGNAGNGVFVPWFSERWPAIKSALENGDQYIEVR